MEGGISVFWGWSSIFWLFFTFVTGKELDRALWDGYRMVRLYLKGGLLFIQQRVSSSALVGYRRGAEKANSAGSTEG